MTGPRWQTRSSHAHMPGSPGRSRPARAPRGRPSTPRPGRCSPTSPSATKATSTSRSPLGRKAFEDGRLGDRGAAGQGGRPPPAGGADRGEPRRAGAAGQPRRRQADRRHQHDRRPRLRGDPALVRREPGQGVRRGRPRPVPRTSPWCAGSRSVSSPPWCRGTTRWRWRSGSSLPRWPPATASCSSRRRNRRSRCCASRSWRRRRDFPTACSASCPGAGPVVGAALGRHPAGRRVTFTGSTATGRLFQQYAGQSNLKQVWIEAGGKSAAVVLDDVSDLDAVADGVVAGIFTNAGQVCSATSRLVVQRRCRGRRSSSESCSGPWPSRSATP